LTTDFKPLFRNPHLLTIAGNFWKRNLDLQRFPFTRNLYKIDPKTTIVVLEHQPADAPRGQILFLHGLEGSAQAGYVSSFSQASLLEGFGVHRINLRTCGGTEALSETMYHSGLTGDTAEIARRIKAKFRQPVFLIGFSLGGNVALKLAGEFGDTDVLSGVCAVSPPIDLATCVRAIDKPSNILYARRFVDRLKQRIRKKSLLSPSTYQADGLNKVRSIWQFDDTYTAPLFGFGNAENYYRTQSASNYLNDVRIPTLVVTSKDDPLVPFSMFDHPAFRVNPALTLAATEHGGHLGFLSSTRPRFWLEHFVLRWISGLLDPSSTVGTESQRLTSV